MTSLAGRTLIDTYKDLLQVSNNNIGVDETSRYIEDGEGTPSMLSLSTTSVGIGTTSPSAELHVNNSSTSSTIRLTSVTSTTSTDGAFLRLDNSGNFILNNKDTGVTIFQEQGNEVMRITSGGNVGVGTTSPIVTLHVDSSLDGPIFDSGGTGNSNHALLVRDSASNQLLRVNNNGNVGIGTTSPNKTLEVAGNIRATKTSVDGGDIALELNAGGGADHPTLDVYDKDGNDGARITANGNSWLSAKGGNVGIGTTEPTMSLDVPGGTRIGNIVHGQKIYKFRTGTAGSELTPTLRFLIPSSSGAYTARFRMVGLHGFFTNYYFHRDIVLCGYAADYTSAYSLEVVQDTYHWNHVEFDVQSQIGGDPSTGQMYIDMSFTFSQNYRMTMQTEWMSERIENGAATTPFQVVGLMLSGADDS